MKLKSGRILRPWLCIAALFGSQLVALLVLVAFWALFPKFRYWVQTPFGTFAVIVFGGLAAFLVVIIVSHPRSPSELLRPFEFESFRRGANYFLIAGLILGLAGVLLAQITLPADFAQKYPLTKPFIHQPGPEKFLFIILLLVGPVFEEIIMRGFLYRAFRESYGITLSISTMVLVATFTHWGLMTASGWIFSLLAVLEIIQCLILEKTGNLWNCIACHIGYNATVALTWLR